MVIDRSKWSSGELWTMEEEERLRQAYLRLIGEMPERSEAAIRARINRIMDCNRGWPEAPLLHLSKGYHT